MIKTCRCARPQRLHHHCHSPLGTPSCAGGNSTRTDDRSSFAAGSGSARASSSATTAVQNREAARLVHATSASIGRGPLRVAGLGDGQIRRQIREPHRLLQRAARPARALRIALTDLVATTMRIQTTAVRGAMARAGSRRIHRRIPVWKPHPYPIIRSPNWSL